MRAFVLAILLSATSTFVLACGAESAPHPPNVAQILPPASGPVLYRFPVNGNWRVHRTHYGVANDQAYALDLVLDAPFPTGSVMKNPDFPSYGQPVVADARGVVVIAVDGVPDNTPGSNNVYDMHGNFVVIDHENGEFSLFAHLMPGTVRVQPGMPIAAGTEIGRCGNSGHSSMPHLHWQVMSSAHATGATGIPPRFVPYQRNGVMSTELPQANDHFVGR